MKWKLFSIHLLLILTAFAQPNFNGGANDGAACVALSPYAAFNMYKGGSADGAQASALTAPSAFNLYKGGASDGFAWNNGYAPLSINMYNGGGNDGFTANSLPANNFNIFKGGNSDGQSASALTAPTAFNLYAGGTGDGFAQNNGYSPVAINLFTGGTNDGFSNSYFNAARAFNLYAGGNSDGFGSSKLTPSAMAFNPYRGGSKDGFAFSSSVAPPPVQQCGVFIQMQLARMHDITKHTGKFTWTKFNSTATSYTIRLKTGGVNGTVIRNIALPYDSNTVTIEFTGLPAGSYYCIDLQEHCAPGFSTGESSYACFTTWPDDCPPPSIPQHLGNTGSSVSLGWTPGVTTAGVSNYGYEIELIPLGSGASYNFGGTITGTPMNRTITCLPTGTFFTYKIREQCGVNKYSDSITGTTYTSPGCAAPANLTTTVVNTQNAKLSWSSSYYDQANRPYQLSYGRGITSPEGGIYSPVTVIQAANVSGAIRTHNFYAEAGVGDIVWYVREICGLCDTTAWAGPFAIPVIGCTLPAATGMNASTVTATGAIVNWTSSNYNTSALLEVRNQSTGAVVSYPVPANGSYNFTETVSGLTAATTYNWRIKQYCPNGDSTGYSGWNEFTTPGTGTSCAVPTNQGIFTTFGSVLIAKWESPLYLDGTKNYQVAAGMNITSPAQATIVQTSGYYRTQSPTNPTHFFSAGNTPGFTWFVRDECSPGVWSDWLGPYIMGSAKTDGSEVKQVEGRPDEVVSFELYPNPNSGNLITLKSNALGNGALFTIYNLQGDVIAHHPLNPSGLSTIDVSALPDAVYLCKISSPALVKTARLVIQR